MSRPQAIFDETAAVSDDALPISVSEGAALFARVFSGTGTAPGPVVLAVSGGPDSMAMLWLAAQSRAELSSLGIDLNVATVDHGLREAARAEAETVSAVCAALDLPHRTLRWEGAKPSSNLQGSARRARYRLLEEAAAAIGATAILAAHHQDDQIETHFLAQERHAGDRGLAGMRMRRALAPGIDLLRPFLDMPGRRLRATASGSGLPVFADPSNDDERYGRVRLRRAANLMGKAERDERLAGIARHRAIRDRIDRAVATVLAESGATVDAFGRVSMEAAPVRACPAAVRAEALGRVLVAVAGREHMPERAGLERLGDALERADGQAVTLGGVRSEAGSRIVFAREYGRSGPSMVPFERPDARILFDDRFEVSLAAGAMPGSSLAGAVLAPFGRLDRGNAAERTLPVLMAPTGEVLAVPDLLRAKVPGVSGRLLLVCRVTWRLWADLPRVEIA